MLLCVNSSVVFLRQGDPSERQGELNFSLEYDYATQTLKLKIIQVRALRFPSYTLNEKHVGKENSKLKAIHLAVQENRLYLYRLTPPFLRFATSLPSPFFPFPSGSSPLIPPWRQGARPPSPVSSYLPFLSRRFPLPLLQIEQSRMCRKRRRVRTT